MRLNLYVFNGIAMFLLVVLVVWSNAGKRQVVSFDRQKIQAQFIRQLAQHNASEQQATRAASHFKKLLQQSLNQYSQKNKAIIFDKSLVLAGSKDVTDSIAEELASLMRKPT